MRAGLDNAFGHPHDQVVDGLEAAGAVTSSVSGTGEVRITNILYDSPVSGETSGEYVWVSASTEEAL